MLDRRAVHLNLQPLILLQSQWDFQVNKNNIHIFPMDLSENYDNYKRRLSISSKQKR